MQRQPQGFTVDRRTAVKWVLAAGAVLQLPLNAGVATTRPLGYGKDPELLKTYKSGELWPLTFTSGQRETARILCDLIIPADDQSPSASSVGVVDFVDEWISAPYPDHTRDRRTIVDGLSWLDAESQRRHARNFAAITQQQQEAICHDISSELDASPTYAAATAFFSCYRSLTVGGFYTTPTGMTDLRYVGNKLQQTYEGPPLAVLKQLGLA